MPQVTLSGVVLGLRSKPYDFNDKVTGERNVGISHRLVVWDQTAKEATELAVPENWLPSVQGLAEGELVQIDVEPRALNNAAITWRVTNVIAAAKASRSS